jgi:succinate dehydrogenase/fumarate reductase flavoprotein subunit
VQPEGTARAEAIEKHWIAGCGLADRGWMERIIDTTWRTLPTLAPFYRFDVNDAGKTVYNALRGPEYVRALRHAALDAGVTILDQSPVLELLLHGDGSVAGANGVRRQLHRMFTVRAGAVILATGGCGFLGGLLGSHTNTGDRHLMALEAGAELSGMEFSNAYSVSPRWNSTRTLIYSYARYYDADGKELDIHPRSGDLARALIAGPVYARLNDCPDGLRRSLPQIRPMTLLPFVRKGVDVYNEPFEVKLFAEGTIRGTGGLRIVGDHCETTVPGLFAAGDTATRELIAGAVSVHTSWVQADRRARRAASRERARCDRDGEHLEASLNQRARSSVVLADLLPRSVAKSAFTFVTADLDRLALGVGPFEGASRDPDVRDRAILP